jgi:hypothetical protein
LSLRKRMTDRSNQNDSKSRQSKRGESASSTNPSELLQLELFERWTGNGGWIKETPYESKPSRDFILPPATEVATDGPPTGESRASSNSTSAALSTGESGND